MNKLKLSGMIALLLTLLFALPMGASAERILPSAIEDDGIVRVYLKSLGAPENLTLTLDGVYTVEHDAGWRFDRGMEIVLSADSGRVWLSAGGLTIDMGPSLTLTRQFSSADENGMRIAETGRNTLYEGDLTVCPEEGGGLRAILSINMEDYLKGVVAYEMSDSWPIEALKAQAVAARTYAMQRKWSAGDRDYDLVDTTADQVFKGFNPEYANVMEAVRATVGVVGTWNDGFATCYYTASNGGETALPTDVWSGTSDAGYLARTRDPYDLENPNSLVVSATFNPGATDLPVLQTMLQEGLEAEAAKLGTHEQELRFEEILSVEPVNPVAEGSLMCKTLRFTLSASAMKRIYLPATDDIGAPGAASEKPNVNQALQAIDYLRRMLSGSPFRPDFERQLLPDSFTVDLDVYSQIKDKLGLSLNGSDYEVVSVKDDVFDFTIEMRRYGHGVGMSQRGAQTMAGSHGKTWTEILKFYYPGMNLEKIDWDTPALAAIEELPESIGAARPDPTPTPTPAPLPALQDGEYYAKVSLGDASSSLNMRKNPTTQSPVVTMLGNGRRVIVCGEADADGWVAIKTAEFSGYAKLEYLTKE